VGALTLRVVPVLVRFMAGQFENVQVVAKVDDPGQFECWMDADSCPFVFGVDRPEEVASPPYPKGHGRPLILGISREVLTDTPLSLIHELLDRQNVAAELKARPGTALVLVRRNDTFLLEEFVRD
jgi:hypothetical protein